MRGVGVRYIFFCKKDIHLYKALSKCFKLVINFKDNNKKLYKMRLKNWNLSKLQTHKVTMRPYWVGPSILFVYISYIPQWTLLNFKGCVFIFSWWHVRTNCLAKFECDITMIGKKKMYTLLLSSKAKGLHTIT